MCGIFGYAGKRNSIKIVVEGLKKLEYRGYDSAGVAGISDGKLFYCKEVGKVATLEKVISENHFQTDLDVAIAQTRWATHGTPNQVNAHPHFDTAHSLAVVHNGIIENHEALRHALKEKGIKFISETDTEVIAHLVADLYDGDILKAVQGAAALLRGSYAFALVHRDFPGQIIAASYESPLVIGLGDNESFVASDSNAFLGYTKEVIFLSKGEVAVVKADQVQIYDASQAQVQKKSELLTHQADEVSKGHYQHYTLKEICEQPQTLRNALLSRSLEEFGSAYFEELHFTMNELLGVERILILACGTSWHAGYVASYLLEDQARIPVQVEISSEFRYKNPVIPPNTLTIAISQSGETADTIAAVREIKAKGSKVIAICNVYGSTLPRESDACIFLRAGPEIGVCSTKAFTSQIVVLSLFSLLMARMRNMSKADGQDFLKQLQDLPNLAQQVLDQAEQIQRIAKKYAAYQSFFFIGRNHMFPASLEGALKLKEISYVNANGYPAGEMKHGPIALINEDCPTVALCANQLTLDKLLSNLMEIKARHGKIIAIAERQDEMKLREIVDDLILIPNVSDELASIPCAIATQLLAYYIARERGADIDQPRNLAKSVTVE